MHTALEWLQILGFGAVLGAAGQLIRTIAGLKKVNEQASSTGASFGDIFSASQLVVSVLIGSVAGMLGAIALGIDLNEQLAIDKLVALMGTGYAGADFIEAFMTRLGAAPPSPGPQVAPVVGAGAAPPSTVPSGSKQAVG
jgi:hypothetical protein